MLTDLAIDLSSGDRLIVAGQFLVATGRRAVAQWLWARLNTFKGEFWLNTNYGFDDVQMMARPTHRALIEADLKAEITGVPGVRGLLEWSLDFNFQARVMTLVATVLVEGEGGLSFTATQSGLSPWVILLSMV